MAYDVWRVHAIGAEARCASTTELKSYGCPMPHSADRDTFDLQSASHFAQARQRPLEQFLQRVLVVLPHAVQRHATKSLVWVRRDIQVRPFTVLQLSTGVIEPVKGLVASSPISTCSALELFTRVAPPRPVVSFPILTGWFVEVSTAPSMGRGRIGWDDDGISLIFVFCRSLRRGCVMGLALVSPCNGRSSRSR